MITRCPACSTSFHVSAAQLDAAGGTVRCGSCLHIFQAPDHEQNAPARALTLADQVTESVPESRPDEQPAAEPLPPAYRDGVAEIAPEPVFLEARAPSVWPRRLAWLTLNAVLLLALGAQYVYWNFQDVRATRVLGPALTYWCNQFRCPPPRRVALDLLSARRLVVRTHPDKADALAVDFLLVNNATFRQRLPDLELRFTRLDGSLSGAGRFTAAQYAGPNASRLLQPREARPIHLNISDPGAESVNYVLNLLEPAGV